MAEHDPAKVTLTADDLREAVSRGIITIDQRTALVALPGALDREAKTRSQSADHDVDMLAKNEEPLRLVGGANDVFVTIGIVLLALGSLFALLPSFGEAGNLTVLAGIFAVGAWLVGEYITLKQRMKLSSLVLSGIFITAIAMLLGYHVLQAYAFKPPENPLQAMAMRDQVTSAFHVTLAGILVAALVHFWRFRVPIMVAVGAVCLTGFVFYHFANYRLDVAMANPGSIGSFDDMLAELRSSLYVPLLCGLAIFATGVVFDLKDRDRVTTWSDSAFWLHVISAPLIVHPMFVLLTGQQFAFGSVEGTESAPYILVGLVLLFVFAALTVDRRSLLIPALLYFTGLVGSRLFLSETGVGVPPVAIIFLLLGCLIILFGSLWQQIRRFTIGALLPQNMLNKLPPIRV